MQAVHKIVALCEKALKIVSDQIIDKKGMFFSVLITNIISYIRDVFQIKLSVFYSINNCEPHDKSFISYRNNIIISTMTLLLFVSH